MLTDSSQKAASPLAVGASSFEMFQKTAGANQTLFPPRRTTAPRPESDATEIFDTDFEEDFEDGPGRNSPRASIDSVSAHLL